MYDVIIIGGGMGGLYFSYRYSRISTNILLLEKNEYLGGRSLSEDFHGSKISLGTGIGRCDKDFTLISLLNELKIDYNTFITGIDSLDSMKILAKLYKNISLIKYNMIFRDFMEEVLTKEEIKLFVNEAGYTDFQDANAMVTMLHYSLEENFKQHLGIGIKWNLLTEELSRRIPYKLEQEVIRITGRYPNFEITTKDNSYKTRNIVIATTISSIRLLISDPIYDTIRSHPFIRVYSYFEDPTLMKWHYPKMVKTYNKLHFIIPISDNVWMTAYSDGLDALELNEELKDNSFKVMEKYLGKNIIIDDMIIAFWKEGTHYYTRGNINTINMRNPKRGVYVIGESVAIMQGWTEGALRSVEEAIAMITI